MFDPTLSPHYVRFARSLALSASLALPACGSGVEEPTVTPSAEPTESPKAPSPSQESAARTTPPADPAAAQDPQVSVGAAPSEGVTTAVAEAGTMDAATADPYSNPYAQDASADAPRPFHSGPLPPPELPLGWG